MRLDLKIRSIDFLSLLVIVILSTIIFSNIAIALTLPSTVSGTAVKEPATVQEILAMSSQDFNQLDSAAAFRSLNKLSAAGHGQKLNELFNAYARDRMGLSATFQLAIQGQVSESALKAPKGNQLDLKTLKGFLQAHTADAVTVVMNSNGFELRVQSKQGATKTTIDKFDKVSFTPEGDLRLDDAILRPAQGYSQTAIKDSPTSITLIGDGTARWADGKDADFHGQVTLAPDRFQVSPFNGQSSWIRIEGQRVIANAETIGVYTDQGTFGQDRMNNKVLITTLNGMVVVRPITQLIGEDGKLIGNFDIARSINIIGKDGKSIGSEEIVHFERGKSSIPTTTPWLTYDSLFSRLESTVKAKGGTIMLGRNNDPALVGGIQHLLGISESDSAGTPYFGKTTREAVLAFQRTNGIKVDGMVGPETYRALDLIYDKNPSAVVIAETAGFGEATISDTGISTALARKTSNGKNIPVQATRYTGSGVTTERDAPSLSEARKLVSGFGVNGCYRAAARLASEMGYDMPPSPNRLRDAGVPEVGTFREGTFQQIPLTSAKVGDPVFFQAPNSRWGDVVSHIAIIVNNDNPSDPVIAHSFGGRPLVQTLSQFRAAYAGGSQGWDVAKVYAYTKVPMQLAKASLD